MVGFLCGLFIRYLLSFTLPRSRRKALIFMLLAENRLLKRQIAQQHKRIRFNDLLRSLFVQLLSRFPANKKFLTIVTPETVLKLWKNRLKKYWTYPSKKTPGRPRITKEVRSLILEIKKGNPSYGYLRIAGELKKLAIDVSTETIRRVLKDGYKKGDLPPTGTWKQFLKLHWDSLFCCDLFTVDTLMFKRFYVFFIMELKSRSISQIAITTKPTMAFVTNQLKGFMYDRSKQETWLIHDNVATTPYSPNMNAHAERFVGSIRREILDKMLIFSQRQLRTVVSSYVHWYNNQRPHQGINNNCPGRSPPQTTGKITSHPVLFGLYQNFYRKAS
ncbi:MAG: hypothetical protein D6B26_07030 [Spirochaetaceae bacterium]|nr:MAG: hypothetical protein D6B26_07030 [Spirochaetaceae bacterium]